MLLLLWPFSLLACLLVSSITMVVIVLALIYMGDRD